jgi:hypothetical protein
MNDLQDKLDRRKITLDEYHERWLAENERLHPGIHDRLFEYLMAKCPAPVLMLMNFCMRITGPKVRGFGE